ncbi:hypothetical protein EVAR_79708_1 [Eumeta japonica]|uniref:Uncharacterized protein n=1 Tax=Eumeta variegata TaxID=151549 RepID=A0A4C1TCJ8_EUMVA|nr:hypothetical protein EVAR_79708_1 [Eumeta japonica]
MVDGGSSVVAPAHSVPIMLSCLFCRVARGRRWLPRVRARRVHNVCGPGTKLVGRARVPRETDSGRLHEDTGTGAGPEIMVAPDSEAPAYPRIAAAACESPSAVEVRHGADLYIRTSWVDAALALSELEKVFIS